MYENNMGKMMDMCCDWAHLLCKLTLGRDGKDKMGNGKRKPFLHINSNS